MLYEHFRAALDSSHQRYRVQPNSACIQQKLKNFLLHGFINIELTYVRLKVSSSTKRHRFERVFSWYGGVRSVLTDEEVRLHEALRLCNRMFPTATFLHYEGKILHIL